MAKTELVLLNVLERKALKKHEKTIEEGKATFMAVGTALVAIRDERLYRESHANFSAYVKDRYDFGYAWAKRLIQQAEVTANLSEAAQECETGQKDRQEMATRVATPEPSAGAAAALSKLPDDQQAAAWADAVEAAEGPPTVAQVKETVQTYLADNEPYKEPEEEEEAEEEEPTVEERMAESNRALEGFARSLTSKIKEAIALEEPHLDEERIEQMGANLRSAAGVVRAAKGAGECRYCGGKGCKSCLKTGWLNKTALESAPQK